MFGGNLHRIAKAEAIAFGDAEFPCPAFGLVGDEDQRRASRLRNQSAKCLSSGVTPARASNTSSATIGIADRGSVCWRMRPASAGGIGIFETGGIDDGELEIEQPRQRLRGDRG